MAEVLIVVAIVIVLAGVGFIALMSHMRTMHQLELDGHAKEIFVAAQNHLSMAKGQDYLGLTNDSDFGTVSNLTFTAGGEATGDESEEGKGIYYLLVDDASDLTGVAVLKQILPFGSMDEAARTQGSYIIRYQKDPGIVLDVFYSEKGDKRFAHTLKEGDYATLMADRGSNDGKKQRRDYTNAATSAKNAVIGWYGGGAEGLPTGEKLKIPGVEIENGDRLLVRVTDYNTDVNGGKNALNLMIDCGSVTIQIPLLDKDGKPAAVSTSARRTESSNTYTVVLDDVTENNLHFAQLYSQFPSDNVGSIVPGCDIKVYAVAYNNDYLTNVAESPKQETNSLFASPIKESKTAKIASIRHLLNLDYTISGLSAPIERAEQISDLVWDDGDAAVSGCFLDNIKGAATQIYPYNGGAASDPSAAGSYMPVNPPSGLNYQGLPGTNHITGITVTGGTGAAGLFGSLDSGSVTDLELIDFKVSASGDVGALAGSAANTYITGVLARSSKTGGVGDKSSGADIDYKIVSTGAAAGGLVGSMNNGTVDRSAAAVYVQGKTNVGGLVGGMNNGVVTKSYSGGHTQNAKYQEATAVSEEVYTIVNVISEANAGGLIGHMDGTTVEYSYSTASSTGATVGGLVGASAGGTVKTCYAIGLVNPTGDGPASSLVGSFTSSTTFDGDNNYLEGVSSKANNTGYTSISAVSGISAGADKTSFLIPEASRKPAYPYDKTLVVNFGTKTADNEDIVGYFFPTIDQLASLSAADSKPGITDRHVGDWQLPTMTPLNYMLLNEDSLDLIIELKEDTTELTFAVTGETSGVTRIFNLGLSRSEDTWTINSVREYAKGSDGILLQNASASASIFDTRLGKYEKFATGGKRTVSKDGETLTVYDVKITLDDIRGTKSHFAQLLADTTKFKNEAGTEFERKLIPGENITVKLAGGDVGWSELETLKYFDELSSADQQKIKDYAGEYHLPENYNYCAHSDNSLFALGYKTDRSDIGNMGTAKIAYLRHLQNLDTSISGVNIEGIASRSQVTTAELTKSFDWAAEKSKYATIRSYDGGAAVSGTFNGIYNCYLSEFKGNGNTLKNFEIGNTGATATVQKIVTAEGVESLDTWSAGYNNAGFFRYVKNAIAIHDLTFENLVVSGKDNVGAVVASNDGTVNLRSVLVKGEYNSSASEGNRIVGVSSTGKIGDTSVDNAAAGGLVGCNRGTLTINNCASAVYVTSAGGPAGGLVGELSSGTVQIFKSYVGGHVGRDVYDDFYEKYDPVAEYYTDTDEPIRLDGTEPYLDSGNRTQRWNIISTAGAAGGLIGKANAGSKVGIEKSFSTASVYSAVSKSAGGVIGIANGSFEKVSGVPGVSAGDLSGKVLDLVYTVAPVYSVKMTDAADGTNGAVLGTHGSSLSSAPSVFYLADVYENAVITEDNSGALSSNLCWIGDGTAANMTLLSLFAASSDPSAAIIGVQSGDESHGYTDLEEITTAYNSALAGNKEYPFAIWTQFGNKLHFYGDWQPVEKDPTETFIFHFLMEDPENALSSTEMPVTYFPNQSGVYTMAIQMNPFRGAEIPIPTIPYVAGYNYGYAAPGASAEDKNIAWTVYYGDLHESITSVTDHQSTAANEAQKLLDYDVDYLGGSVEFSESNLTTALEKGAGNITFVAHYTKTPGYTLFKLMDAVYTDGSVTSYKNVGGIQLLDTSKSYKESFGDGSLYVPRRSLSGYHFLGWYTGTVSGGEVTLDSEPLFKINGSGVLECVDESRMPTEGTDTVLFAKYEPIQETSMTLKFVLQDDEGNETPLDAEFILSFDKKLGFDQEIVLPGSEDEDSDIKGVTVKKRYTADGEAVDAGAEEFEFIPKAPGSESHKAVHISTGVQDNYPVEYIIYIKGNIVTIGYYVVHVKVNPDGSEAVADNGMVWKTSPNHYPNLTNSDVIEVEGFKVSEMPKAPVRYNTANASANALITQYGIPAQGGTGDDVLPTSYFFVVKYKPSQFELSFENLGGSASSKDFRFRMMDFGADLTEIKKLTPTWTGHVFSGWKFTKKSDGSVIENPETMPGYDMVMTPVWGTSLVGYNVAFWFENPDDTEYSYLGTVRMAANNTTHPHLSEDVVYASEFSNPNEFTSLPDVNKYKNYMIFENNSGYDPEGVKLSYDGKTVVNVYFKRKTFTLTFQAQYKGWVLDNENGTHGKVGDDYLPLTPGDYKWYYNDTLYTGQKYRVDSDNGSYGWARGKARPLTYHNDRKYCYMTEQWDLVDPDDNSGEQYRKVNYGWGDDYEKLSYRQGNNGRYRWQYQDWRGRWQNYNGDRYKRVETKTYVDNPNFDWYGNPYIGSGWNVTYLETEADRYWTYSYEGQDYRYSGERYSYYGNSGDAYGDTPTGMQKLEARRDWYLNGQPYTGDRYRKSNTTSLNTIYTITAKYEADISDKWSFVGADGVSYPETGSVVTSWEPGGSTTYTARMFYMDIMPGENVTFKLFHSSNRKRETLNYYVESNNGDKVYKGKKYKKELGLTVDYNFVTYNEDYFPLNGFTRLEAAVDGQQVPITWGSYESTNKRYPRSNSFNGGEALNFYYTRNSYNFERWVDGDAETLSVKFEASLDSDTYKGTPERPEEYPEAEYDFDGWYKDPNYQNKFDFTGKTMPAANTPVYGRWKHKDLTVTFDPNGGNMSQENRTLTVPYGSVMDILDENGALKPDYTPTAPEGYVFGGWDDDPGDNIDFIYSSPIYSNMNLKAVWDKKGEDVSAKVRIVYKDYSTDTVLPTSVTGSLPTETEKHLKGDKVNQQILLGDTFTMDVPLITGYTRAGLPESTILVTEAVDEIILYYRETSWDLTVNYHFVYNGITAASWVNDALPAGVTLTEGSSEPVYYHKVTRHIDNQFDLVAYKQPTPETEGWGDMGDLSWLSYYTFDHFVYNGKTVNESYVTVSQDAAKTLDIYLTPDPDAVPLEDNVTFYDGSTKMNHTPAWTLECPAGATSRIVPVYYYYDTDSKTYIAATNAAADGDKIKDAGTYGMREYLLVTVSGKTYLIWQSDKGTSQTPPLHLYVRRRVVIMQSESAEAVYYDGICLVKNDPDTDVKLWDGLAGVPLDGYEFGFAPGEGTQYVFSANAFRRIVGKTPNEFSYVLNDNTDKNNYNFFVRYGTLWVKESAAG